MSLDVARSADPPTTPAPLAGSVMPLSGAYDVGLLDLDGVVYRGDGPVPHAAAALATARARGMRLAFVTNNALRPPDVVVAKLAAAGVPAGPQDVVTSAQAAARVLADRLPAGSRVLVAGGEGLRLAVREAGLEAVDAAADDPVAVVQGYDPQWSYPRLAEAALAIRAGALWVASNTDATVPTERGLLPGAGALVAALRTATDLEPIVAGKPELALHEESVRRSGARRPLIVGDRLDTDIEAGTRSGTPALLVLTGVTSARDLVGAGPAWRPTYVAADLRGLQRPAPAATATGTADGARARCGAWTATITAGTLTWATGSPPGPDGLPGPDGPNGRPVPSADEVVTDGSVEDDGLDALRAACAAAWAAADAGRPFAQVVDPPAGCADLG